jgi:PleD family two-component response regulator
MRYTVKIKSIRQDKPKVAAILILDEETDSRMLLKRVMELNGHQVAACRDTEQALAELASRQFDLAILNTTTQVSSPNRFSDMLKAYNSRVKVMTIIDYKESKTSKQELDGTFLIRPLELETIETKVRELLLNDK